VIVSSGTVPPRVVPDQRPLNGCACVCVCVCACVRACVCGDIIPQLAIMWISSLFCFFLLMFHNGVG